MNMEFSRYTLNELKSLHLAIIQDSKGNPAELKKNFIVVMNMCGILVEEDRFSKVKNVKHRKQKSMSDCEGSYKKLKNSSDKENCRQKSSSKKRRTNKIES